MQVLTFLLCVKFLVVAIVCAQEETTVSERQNSAETTTIDANDTNDVENNITTILVESTSIVPPTLTENTNVVISTTLPPTTLESSTNKYLTTTVALDLFTFIVNSTTTTSNIITTSERVVTTTQNDHITTTEQPSTYLQKNISTTVSDTISTLAPTTTENINVAKSTTIPSTTLESSTNGYSTTTVAFGAFTVTENFTTTSANITTTTEYTVSTTQFENITTTEQPCISPDTANLTITFTWKTEVGLSIQLIANWTICPTEIEINCNSNDTLPWIVQAQNLTLEFDDTLPQDVVLGNLSEFTNYTCDLKKENFTYLNFSFTTKQEVPSIPTDLNIDVQNSTSFIITWTEPKKIPSLLEGYLVTITRGDVATEGHIWNNCSSNYTYSLNVANTSCFFHEALADFHYNVSVQAISNVGYSDAAVNETVTPIAAPDSPENVTFKLIEQDRGFRNVGYTQNITWHIPCNTNGPVSYFQIELEGYYSENRTDIREANISIDQNQFIYSYEAVDVWAATNYTVTIYLVGNMTGYAYYDEFSVPDNYPNAPEIATILVNARSFSLTWREPTNNPGKIEYYVIYIDALGVNWKKTEACILNDEKYNYNVSTSNREFATSRVVPGATYNISLAAKTSKGEGIYNQFYIISNISAPDQFSISSNFSRNTSTDNYDDNVTISFKPGCFNGPFDFYFMEYSGIRDGYSDIDSTVKFSDYNLTHYIFGLSPEYTYNVNFTIKNSIYQKSKLINFTAPAGVPDVDVSHSYTLPITPEDTQTTLTFKRENFDESRGTLTYLAVIISDENVTGGDFSEWNGSQWPTPVGNASIYYQANDKYWRPFNESVNTVDFVIGADTSCTEIQYCNKPLESGKQYFVILRLFNENFYRNTMPIPFVTKTVRRVVVIVSLTLVALFLSIIGFVGYKLWQKGRIRCPPWSPADTQGPSTEIPINKFVAYCKYLEQNPDVLKAQWIELEEQSKVIYNDFSNHFAVLMENKRKNRYTNILPFDHSRVKLNIDEDDEICSDYINASYIKGFSNRHEYIATQGPLSHTCRDFWKMILQERVSIIIMVSRFIEGNKDKCYKYFPSNRETMTVPGDDIEVRCSTELHFGFYCIRTLQVKKDLKQIAVTHMQFLEWPDFGVPGCTESMLHFCHQLKERWATEGGMAVVHCSAGVGRTGTIIATDILLRALKAGRKLDVFNTVLDLRRDRKSMVQTEKQYMYIYQLIRSMIEFPIADEQDNQEHLYENLDPKSKNGIVESAL